MKSDVAQDYKIPTVEIREVRIFTPEAGQVTNVRTSGPSDPSGHICVRGLATDRSSDPVSIHAMVFLTSSVPSRLDQVLPGATPGTIINGNRRANFKIELVPDAGCDSAGTVDNTVVIWTTWPGNDVRVDRVEFRGKQSTQTECGISARPEEPDDRPRRNRR